MSFDPNHYPDEHGSCEWYRPVHPNEHIYTAGYGFSPRPPFLIEQKLIGHCSAATVACLIGFLFLSSLLTQFCAQLFNRFFPIIIYPMLAEPTNQFSMLFGSIGALTIPFVLYALHTHIPPQSALPLRRVSSKLVLASVMVSLSVSVIGIYASEASAYLFSALGIYFYEPILIIPTDTVSMIFYVLNLTMIPAVFEELAFRGILMQSLRRFGDSFALVVSAILFSLVHISPLSIPNAFVMGLVIGYFVLFTGSVHTGIIIHLVHNLLALLISQLGGLDHSIANLIFLSIQLIYLVFGAAAIIWLMRSYENIFALKNSATINRSNQKLRCFFCTLPFFLFLVVIFLQARAFLI